jgi:hypothetical protein
MGRFEIPFYNRIIIWELCALFMPFPTDSEEFLTVFLWLVCFNGVLSDFINMSTNCDAFDFTGTILVLKLQYVKIVLK